MVSATSMIIINAIIIMIIIIIIIIIIIVVIIIAFAQGSVACDVCAFEETSRTWLLRGI